MKKEGNEETSEAGLACVFVQRLLNQLARCRRLVHIVSVKWIVKHPLTWITCLGLLLAWVVAASGWQYDSPGLHGMAFWASWLLALPVWAVGEVWGSQSPGWLVIAVALVLCWLIEWGVLRLARRWRRSMTSGALTGVAGGHKPDR
jgi:hypothetical protein